MFVVMVASACGNSYSVREAHAPTVSTEAQPVAAVIVSGPTQVQGANLVYVRVARLDYPQEAAYVAFVDGNKKFAVGDTVYRVMVDYQATRALPPQFIWTVIAK